VEVHPVVRRDALLAIERMLRLGQAAPDVAGPPAIATTSKKRGKSPEAPPHEPAKLID
jgi:hypothetical protein